MKMSKVHAIFHSHAIIYKKGALRILEYYLLYLLTWEPYHGWMSPSTKIHEGSYILSQLFSRVPYKQWRILEGTGEGNSPLRFWENYILVHALLKVTNFILNVKQICLISCVLVNSKIVYWSLIFMNNIYVYLWNTYDERKWLF